MCLIWVATLLYIILLMWCHFFFFVFSFFPTGSSLKSEKTTLQLVWISRRIRWLHDVAVNWSSTSHLSQEEDRLCSRSGNRTLVKIWYFWLLRASLFRRRSCKVRNTRESCAIGVGENRCAFSLLAWFFSHKFFPRPSVSNCVRNQFHHLPKYNCK